MNRGLFARTYVVEEDQSANAQELVAVIDQDTTSDELVDTITEGQDIASEISVVDTGETALGELEATQEFVESTVEQGGMNDQTAEAIKLQVESILDRIGKPRGGQTKLATENFKDVGASQRLANTKLAIEEINNEKKDVLKAIMDKIKEIWAKVVAWVTDKLDSTKRLEAQAVSLKKEVQSLGDGEFKDFEIKTRLSIFSDLNTYLTKYNEVIQAFVSNIDKNIGKKAEDVDFTMSIPSSSVKAEMAKVTKSYLTKVPGMEQHVIGVTDAVAVVLTTPSKIEDKKDAIKAALLTSATVVTAEKMTDQVKGSSVSKDMLISACDVVINVCKELRTMKNTIASVSSSLNSAGAESDESVSRVISKQVSVLNKLVTSGTQAFISECIDTVNFIKRAVKSHEVKAA